VVSNDGDHGETEKSGVIRLKAGYHKIRVYFHNSGGGANLTVRYASDLIAKNTIPDSVLFRNGIPFPEISGLRDTTMFEEDSISISFKAKLEGSQPSVLQASGVTSKPGSIPSSNLYFSGTDSIRTLKVKTLPGVVGNVVVYVGLRSVGGNTGVKAFRINVLTRNPNLSQVADTFLVMNNGFINRPITVSDPDNAATTLNITATSGNNNLIPNNAIQVSGSGSNRFISLTPANNATGTSTITYKVTDPSNRSVQKTFLVTVGDTSSFRTPDNSTNPVNGLNYVLARADGGNVLNFASVLPDKAGVINNFSLNPAGNNLDFFGLEYTGFIKIKKTAAYTFFTNSDDGSMLYIGNTQVVDNDGGHSTQERSGSINLKAGLHKITVKYKEGNGNETLEVRYTGGGITKRLIPDSLLFRNGFTHPSISASTDTAYGYKTWFKTVPFTLTDADGDVATATSKIFSYTESIVPAVAMAVGGSGADRSLDFIPTGFGVVKLKVVMTDDQGLPAIQTFNVRIKDTNVVSSTVPVLRTSDSKVVPNPVKSRFEISGLTGSESIIITDARGKRIYSGLVSEADLSGFQKGMYFIRTLSEMKSYKVLKD
jgi:hypothetical protein